jgi:Protein of unknown function (DUF2911)
VRSSWMKAHLLAVPSILTLLVAGSGAGPRGYLAAQEDERPRIPASQLGQVMQRIGYTDVSVTYRRPVARGRTLFGGVVRWGRIWTPGADSATTISFSRDVQIEGHPLEAGRYSLWAIPVEDGPWTIIVSHKVDIFHTPYPGSAYDVLRFEVTPRQGEHMELLSFSFPVVTRDSAELWLHWGTTIIPLHILTSVDD